MGKAAEFIRALKPKPINDWDVTCGECGWACTSLTARQGAEMRARHALVSHMSAPKPYDDALVEQLVVGAYVPAAADWKWLDETDIECEEESGVRAVLDRLVELGWRPPVPASDIVINASGQIDKAEALRILRRSIKGRGTR